MPPLSRNDSSLSLMLVLSGFLGTLGCGRIGYDSTTNDLSDQEEPPPAQTNPEPPQTEDQDSSPQDESLVAMYVFSERGTSTVRDVSGSNIAPDLELSPPEAFAWSDSGLRLISGDGTAVSSAPPDALVAALQASNEYSVEVWATPDEAVGRGPSRLVSLSLDATAGNLGLMQGGQPIDSGCGNNPNGSSWLMRVRTTESDRFGCEPVSTGDMAEASLTHIVGVKDATGVATIYVNGTPRATLRREGSFANWDPTFRLSLFNEPSCDRPWFGELHMVGIYDRAMSAEEVETRFQFGAP